MNWWTVLVGTVWLTIIAMAKWNCIFSKKQKKMNTWKQQISIVYLPLYGSNIGYPMADVCNECLGGNGGGCIDGIWLRSGPEGIDDDDDDDWERGGTPVKWLLARNSDDLFGDDLW